MNNAELEKFEKLLIENKKLLEQQHNNLIELSKSLEQLLGSEVTQQKNVVSNTTPPKNQTDSSTNFFSEKSDRYFFDSFLEGRISLMDLIKETLKNKNEDQKVDFLIQLYNDDRFHYQVNPLQTLFILFDVESAIEGGPYFQNPANSDINKDRDSRIKRLATFLSKISDEKQNMLVNGLLSVCGSDYNSCNISINELVKEAVSFLPRATAKCVLFRGVQKAFESIQSGSGSGCSRQLCVEQVPDSVNAELTEFFKWFLDSSRIYSSEDVSSYLSNYTRLLCGNPCSIRSFLTNIIDCFLETLREIERNEVTTGWLPADSFRIYSENYTTAINLASYFKSNNDFNDELTTDDWLKINDAQNTVGVTLLKELPYEFLASFALTKDWIKNYVDSAFMENVENVSEKFLELFSEAHDGKAPDTGCALAQANCILSEFEQLTSMEKHQLFGIFKDSPKDVQQKCFKALQTLAEVDSNVDFDKLHDVCVKISEKKKLQK